MNARMITTCKGVTFTDEIFPALHIPGATHLQAASDPIGTGFRFGAAITPSSCYELNQMDPRERAALLQKLYGKEGLGLSCARVCVASSDYSAELYSYDDAADDTQLQHFSVTRDEAYVIPMIKEILAVNPDLYLLASPWSPPYWMKTGGSMCGGYMREKYVECYADYMVKFIRAYGEYGIKISAVTPQNETNTDQNGKMPACIWHPETEAKFIQILRQKLDDAGLDVKIWMFDHNFNDVRRVLWSLRECEGLRESCDGVAFHYYEGSVEETRVVKETHPDLELHFTEGGPRLTQNYDTDWAKWGIMIIKSMKAGYSSFTGWNLMLNELGGPNVGPFIGLCGGLVTRDRVAGEIRYSGQYKAFTHLAPYITPESKLYPLTQTIFPRYKMSAYPQPIQDVEGILVKNPDGKQIAILVNPNPTGVQVQLELAGILWYAELQGDCISTLIVE
ncbi:MAG: hypothetical protein IKU11_09690 [Clostridia bacterium]|nr:hypothetical protein [Clostridia bacterium]